MPTFHSIPIHPLLRDRLLQPQQQQQQQQQHHAIGDSDGHQQQLHHHQQQQQQQQQQKQQPLKSNVAIPRSLLTRDPKDLVDIFAASGPTRSRNRNDHEQRMASILALRSQVALAMISKTRNGTRLLRWQQQQQQQQQQRQQRARRRVRVRERERQENGNREPPPPLVAGGSVSLLEAWGMQQEAAAAAAAGTKTPGRLEILSTGCRDLDELVAFPAEYSFSFSFSDGYGEVDLRDGNLPEPEPGSSACAVPVPENAETNTNTNMDSTGGGDTVGGLPRGYVLKLSGTTGKTQLALRFAARAATQSLMLASSSRRRSSQQQEGCERRERIRIRYCYSTAGHSGQSLAQRVFHHIETTLQQYQNNNNNNNNNAEGRAHGHGRCGVSSNDVAKSIEFQPIASLAQLVTTIAKLEQEWLKHATTSELQCGEGEQEPSPPPPPPQGEGAQRQRGPGRTGPVSMLVLDALPWMMIEREESERIRSLHRWLKRLARHYSVWIVVVTSTGDGGGSSSSTSASSLYHHAMPSDIQLRLQKQSPTQSSLRLMRHPAKAVTEQDCITILHNSGDGITTPHR
eukprot:jgi/Psemu1/2696/gm1.2696_g